MNMFVGVIFVQFSEEQRKEKATRFHMVTDDQMRWMMVQELVSKANPRFDIMLRPQGKLRMLFYRMVNSRWFEVMIMVVIILNIISLAMVYEGMSDTYTATLDDINIGFMIIFILECIAKLIALDFQYFKVAWNNFDFIIVLLSIVDFIMDQQGSSTGFLSKAPQFARLLRVLRVSRLFKLMKAKQLKGINKIIKTLLFSFPSLMNVLVLLFLLYFIFSVLAVYLFEGTPHMPELGQQAELFNFDNFHMALITLFRCSTGEDWPTFMYHYGQDSALDSLKSRLFFLTYIFLSSTVMLQVFQLVVMQQFDEYYFNPDNPINSFDDISESFRQTWNRFTTKTRGTMIKSSRIVEFFHHLE
jgi:hypothetical protein